MRSLTNMISVLVLAASPGLCAAQTQAPTLLTFTTDYLTIRVGTDGRIVEFSDRQPGVNYCTAGAALAHIKKDGASFAATKAELTGDVLTLEFGQANVTAALRVTTTKRYAVLDVISVSSDQIEEFVLVDIPLTLKGGESEPFAACALALNLQTRVRTIPQASSQLWAACYPRFGFVGAKVAIIGCPPNELRSVMQEVVSAAPDLPHSDVGGPWALDGPNNYGSYLFDFGDLTEETVDSWIELAHQLGVTQIDFHGGRSFRFGDFRPDPQLFPGGAASMKAVIDKLHAAGIVAGLHTYAMFMDKSCAYVTPKPDPRLGKDATFTLAADLPLEATDVWVQEPTQSMSTITGFFVRNSVTLQIDDELITYSDVSKQSPFAFTKCTRGACGTQAATHQQGAQVHHLRECFGLFCPDGDSTLFSEVAAKTAALYNEAGFDMIYLDALDGGDTVAGPENAWHYESKFTFEICKRLQRPAIMEMSTFHHHLWYVRSRMGAWDHPTRSHKKFIDLHCDTNAALGRQFLPGNLGWWAFKTWQGAAGEPTYSDDIEYLCVKALAHNYGLSLMGINPTTVQNTPALPRLAAIVRQYEHLRHANYFSDAVKEQLSRPGDEFTLVHSGNNAWHFRPIEYAKHKVRSDHERFEPWTVSNRFAEQPLRLRMEVFDSVAAYDAAEKVTLADFNDLPSFSDRAAQPGITAELTSSDKPTPDGKQSGLFTASNTTDTPIRAWCKVGKQFEPPIDLGQQQALGVWIHGDGKGEVLNLQQTSPSHLSHGIADHYVVIDFTGWRYCELVEPEGDRHANYSWPYGGIYSIYRESIVPQQVGTLSLWYNNVPAHDTVTCMIGPIHALPTRPSRIKNPSVTIAGRTITFPVTIETGQCLEFLGPNVCTLYSPQGEVISKVTPTGSVPTVAENSCTVEFAGTNQSDLASRVQITIITQGEPLHGTNASDAIRWEFLQDDNSN